MKNSVETPKSVRRVYAKKGDWIYYSYEETEQEFGIMRVNSENICQTYDIRNYADSASDLEMFVFTVSDDGCIAFCTDVSRQDFFRMQKTGYISVSRMAKQFKFMMLMPGDAAGLIPKICYMRI